MRRAGPGVDQTGNREWDRKKLQDDVGRQAMTSSAAEKQRRDRYPGGQRVVGSYRQMWQGPAVNPLRLRMPPAVSKR